MSDAIEFRPTHTVPAGGQPAWSVPDNSLSPAARLDPGLEVQVDEVTDEWAHIICSNGWQAWVDKRLLIARTDIAPVPPLPGGLGPPSAPAGVAVQTGPAGVAGPAAAPAGPATIAPPAGKSKRNLVIAAGGAVVVVVAVVLAVVLTRGGHSPAANPASAVVGASSGVGGETTTTAPPKNLVIPQSVGDYQLTGTPDTLPVGTPPYGFTSQYLKSPGGILVLDVSRWTSDKEAGDELTKLVGDDKSHYGPPASASTPTGGGITYFCVTGTSPTTPRGLETSCRWQVGTVLYGITVNPDFIHPDHPAPDASTMTSLAAQAQAATSI